MAFQFDGLRVRQASLFAMLLASLASCRMPDPISTASSFTPRAPLLRPFADGENWVLAEEMVYDRGDGWRIVVPRGFVTDLTSVPWFARTIVSPVGPYTRAAILHDYLFWVPGCSRRQADYIIYYAMQDSKVPVKDAWKIYRALRMAGKIAFKDNARKREAGWNKFLPPGSDHYWELVHSESWDDIRKLMKQAEVPDPPLGDTSYCLLGGDPVD